MQATVTFLYLLISNGAQVTRYPGIQVTSPLPSLPHQDQWTAVIVAARSGHMETLVTLVEHGANIHQKDMVRSGFIIPLVIPLVIPLLFHLSYQSFHFFFCQLFKLSFHLFYHLFHLLFHLIHLSFHLLFHLSFHLFHLSYQSFHLLFHLPIHLIHQYNNSTCHSINHSI